jgi:hypothetical protein
MHLPPGFLRRAVPYNRGGEAHRWGTGALGISVGKKAWRCGMEWTMGGVQPLQMKVAQAKEALPVATPACESAQTLPRPCLDPAQTLRITFAARSLEEVTESNPIVLWYRPQRLHSFDSHETTSPSPLPAHPPPFITSSPARSRPPTRARHPLHTP